MDQQQPESAKQPLLHADERGTHDSGANPSCSAHLATELQNSSSLGQECSRVLALAVPVTLTQVLGFLAYLITTAQVGHLGSQQLSAITLGRSVFHITGLSLVIGLASGVSTLAGQAHGAGHAALVAAITRRAAIMCCLLGLLVLLCWTAGLQRLMLLLRQEPDIVVLASRFVVLISPALVMEAAIACLDNSLVSQNVVNPLTAVAAVCTLVTPLVNHVFIQVLGMGLDGVAAAYNIVILLNLALVSLTYSLWGAGSAEQRLQRSSSRRQQQQRNNKGSSGALSDSEGRTLAAAPSGCCTCRPFGGGGGSSVFSGWGHYLRVALPSLAMICADWWCFEAMILVAGLQPDAQVQLAVMGILFSTHTLVFFFVSGFNAAASTRVSNLLGAGSAHAARSSMGVCLLLATVTAVLCASGLAVGRAPWAALFSADPKVLHGTVVAMPWMALSLLADGCNSVLSGVLTGVGRQGLGFGANLVAFWMLGLPLAWWWGAARGAEGMWRAMALVSGLQALVLGAAVASFDWRKEAERASRNVREGKTTLAAGEDEQGKEGALVEGEGPPAGGATALPHHGIYEL